MMKFIEQSPIRAFIIAAGLLTLARIILLVISDANLGPDETQYWFWAQTPAAGYFSKPPMIAWAIAFTTGIFGDAAWAVRLSSPLFHLGTAIFLFMTARHIDDGISGFWAGIGWLLLPGITFSSALITTDVPLLFFWSGALYIFIRLVHEKAPGFDDPSLGLAGLLGLCLGLGLLSKYAMIYFFLAMVTGMVFFPVIRTRRVIVSLALGCSIGLIIFTPNILWNAANNFQTVTHTAANANWQDILFHPHRLAEFWLAQLGILGPIVVVVFCMGILRLNVFNAAYTQPNGTPLIARTPSPETLLYPFAAIPLVIVSLQALISRAHANWAATAYPAIILLVSIWLVRLWRNGGLGQHLLRINTGIHLIFVLILSIGLSNFWLVDFVGLSNSIKRVRGWQEHGEAIEAVAADYGVIMSDDRKLTGQLLYHANLADRGIIAWDSNQRIDHHYEAFFPFTPPVAEPILYITRTEEAPAVTPWFSSVILVDETTVSLNRGRYRTLYMYEISGFQGR